jgi:L-ascorbate metabolism protein UlaG (beta-lactamase superfamily)
MWNDVIKLWSGSGRRDNPGLGIFDAALWRNKMSTYHAMPVQMRRALFSLLSGLILAVCAASAQDQFETGNGKLLIHPIHHASFVMEWNNQSIYVDPVGGAKIFAKFPKPDVILLTDIHGDHLEPKTLEDLIKPETRIVAPAAVVQMLPASLRKQASTLVNGATNASWKFPIEAIAAYNTTEDRLKFHAKGRGNGYVLTLGNKRLYISGDTEETPEMRALKDIDIAFVCMNLPYTMDVDQAAKAVRAFHPKVVYPYHYRGSDLEHFKQLLKTDAGTEVRIRDWYASDTSASR